MKKFIYQLAYGDEPVFTFGEDVLPKNPDPTVPDGITIHMVTKYLAQVYICACHPVMPAEEVTPEALVGIATRGIQEIRCSHREHAEGTVSAFVKAHGEEPACLVFVVRERLAVKPECHKGRVGFNIACRVGFIALPGIPEELRDASEVSAFPFEDRLLNPSQHEALGMHLALALVDTLS